MKTDKELGKKVSEHLKSLGLETPLKENNYSDEGKVELIKLEFEKIMNTLGLDLTDDSLRDTPSRYAKMFVYELFKGLKTDNFPKCTSIENKMQCDEMVVVKNINVMSNCEHHFVTIDGVATVAYIPNKKVIGLSKINRIVDYFSRRPQVQERLTNQIFETLCFILGTKDVAVLMEATHYCVKSRGVEDLNSFTITSKLGGVFRNEPTSRAEFLSLAKG